MGLVEDVRAGKMRAVARAISLIEDDAPERDTILAGLDSRLGAAMVLGLTGPPGSGKSTLADRIIERERRRNKRVAVVAVDPSSPFSGGALLGDRLRMQEHATDPGVFIRSMATRGHLGGVARATGDAVKVLRGAGYDTIIIETVGVGQAEVDIVTLADLVLLVLVPGTGDGIQVMKAGIMEIGDLFVINKSDLPGAEKLRTEVEYVLNLQDREDPQVKRPVVMVSASSEEGVDVLLEEIHILWTEMRENGFMIKRHKRRIERELRNLIAEESNALMESRLKVSEKIDEWVELVYRGKANPRELIRRHLASQNRYDVSSDMQGGGEGTPRMEIR
jgi:LAO/AO transport system kinase